MCDTNGGMLPSMITAAVGEVVDRLAGLGIAEPEPARHPLPERHVLRGGQHRSPRSRPACRHFQCTANGYGERPGNADLFAVVGNLQLKLGLPVLPDGCLEQMVRVSHAIAEIANIAPDTHQAYVGAAAFAHKAGLHASAIKVDPLLYNHVDPTVVGNDMRILVTEMAGRASIELKSRELGLDLAGHPDDAVAGHPAGSRSWRPAAGRSRPPTPRSSCWSAAELPGGAVARRSRWSPTGCMVEHREDGAVVSEATVKVRVRGERVIATAEGNGPVNALDEALRVGAVQALPGSCATFELADYKVRILEGTPRHRRGHPGAGRDRAAGRPRLDHRRRARERRRGELARAGRRAHLRPRPRPGLSRHVPGRHGVGQAQGGQDGAVVGGGTGDGDRVDARSGRSTRTWSMVTGGIGSPVVRAPGRAPGPCPDARRRRRGSRGQSGRAAARGRGWR